MTYGAYTPLDVTSLQSLASSATAGWQSALIDNRATLANDYLLQFYLPMANTPAANDKSWYFYVSQAEYDGAVWNYADGGTTTRPSGTEGVYTISGTTATSNLVTLTRLFYTATQQVVVGSARLSTIFGETMPAGFSLVGINYTGAAASTGCVVAYRAIT